MQARVTVLFLHLGTCACAFVCLDIGTSASKMHVRPLACISVSFTLMCERVRVCVCVYMCACLDVDVCDRVRASESMCVCVPVWTRGCEDTCRSVCKCTCAVCLPVGMRHPTFSAITVLLPLCQPPLPASCMQCVIVVSCFPPLAALAKEERAPTAAELKAEAQLQVCYHRQRYRLTVHPAV